MKVAVKNKNKFKVGDVVILKKSSGYPIHNCEIKIVHAETTNAGEGFYRFIYTPHSVIGNEALLDMQLSVFEENLTESKSRIILDIIKDL